MIEIILLLLLALFARFIWRRYRLMNLRQELGIPGPKPNYLFGNTLEMFDYFEKYGEVNPLFVKWKEEYGNVFGVYFGPSLYVIVNDVEMSREILIKQFSSFDDRPPIPFMGQEPMCNMVSIINGELWKKTRQFLTPSFTTAKLKQMGGAMEDKIFEFINVVDIEAKKGKVFDMYNPFQRLTLDIIGKCAFAMDVKSLTDPEDPFLKNTQTFFKELSMQKSFPMRMCFLIPELNSFISYFRGWTTTGIAESWIFKQLRKVIAARREILHTFKSVDVLQVLLEQNVNSEKEVDSNSKTEKVGSMSESMMEASIFTYLIAGVETTSVALAFTTWLLAKHQNVQKRLQKEIDEKIRSKEPVNYETIHNMVYMDCVFKESLRLYPPVSGFVSRKCTRDCTIKGVNFVKGVQVMFLPRLIHADPDIWPEPEQFNPDRFNNSEKFNPQAWLPFGSGPRNCIGMRFADMEAKMCLFHLLSKYNIELSEGSEDPIKIREADFVMSPKNGVLVKLVNRN